MNPFLRWLRGEVDRRGWARLCQAGGFTSGALQAWLRGSFPGPIFQERLATATGIDLEKLRLLVWESEKLRDLGTPEVEPARSFRRPRRVNGGAAAQAPRPSRHHAPPAAGGRSPITRTPVKKGPSRNYRENMTSSVNYGLPRAA